VRPFRVRVRVRVRVSVTSYSVIESFKARSLECTGIFFVSSCEECTWLGPELGNLFESANDLIGIGTL